MQAIKSIQQKLKRKKEKPPLQNQQSTLVTLSLKEPAEDLMEKQMPSSSNKKKYLSQAPTTAYQLSVDDVQKMAGHYARKYDIKIIVNGQTEWGQKYTRENRQKIQDKIDLLNNQETRLSTYFTDKWNTDTLINKNKRSLETTLTLKQYNTSQYRFNPTDKSFNRCLISACQTLDILQDINHSIDNYIEDLNSSIDKVKLTKSQCMREITALQNTLTEHDKVGYVYANGLSHGKPHIEVLIIQKNKLIKPVNWGFIGNDPFMLDSEAQSLSKNDIAELYSTIIDSSILALSSGKKISTEVLIPQLGNTECGTLGILYLKELLKNQGKQFEQYCLAFSYYEHNNNNQVERRHFFIPSPHTLRYSQSIFFNKAMVAMLQDADYVKFEVKNRSCQIATVRHLLQESIKLAQSQNDLALYQANQELVARLPEFSQQWLQTWDTQQYKWHQMNTADENRYLAYRAMRIQTKQLKHENSNNDNDIHTNETVLKL